MASSYRAVDRAVALTAPLAGLGPGDFQARDDLLPLVYRELRRRAAAYLRRERRDHTLQPTALVHEAYIRLVGQQRGVAESRALLRRGGAHDAAHSGRSRAGARGRSAPGRRNESDVR
jgi:ECF sigma factor